MSVHHNIHNSIACYPLGTFDILSFGAQFHVCTKTYADTCLRPDAQICNMLPIAAVAVNIIANPLKSC